VDQNGHRVVEPGVFELLVGKNSRDAGMLKAEFRITA
jgi:hypothetical protein